MKIFSQLLSSLILAGVLSVPLTLAESINSFHSDIKINSDATINVSETILYNFGNKESHGIYRDIPETFNNNTKILSITDSQGLPLAHETSHSFRNTQLKIGDAYKTITGAHTYVINYQVERELSFFDEHDELYWNVTGTDWGLSIESATAEVTLPFTLSENQAQAVCHTGFYGESEKHCQANITYADNKTVFSFATTQQLTKKSGQNENLTLVAMFPKNLIEMPSLWARYGSYTPYLILLLGLFFIPYYV